MVDYCSLIENGGFETGSLPPWTTGALLATVTAASKRSGNFGCEINYAEYIEQTLKKPILVSELTNLSFWGKNSAGVSQLNIKAYFTDSTNYSRSFAPDGTNWTFCDFLSHLLANGYGAKTIEKIRIYSGCVVACTMYCDDVLVTSECSKHSILINGISTCYISTHFIKSHPNPDPDTFEIRTVPECAKQINFFDGVEIQKMGVTEFYGFVEEITPEVGEDGLEYLITGRCWKLITWKKWNERFQESREVGPVDSEGNIETGFFGSVKAEELVKFIMRCPISEHPKYKVRHKIGWGIASDYWRCCANVTAASHYPEWVALRYTGLAWRGRGDINTGTLQEYVLDVKNFVNVQNNWNKHGTSPYLDAEDDSFVSADASASGRIDEYYEFEVFSDIGEADPVNLYSVWLYCTVFGEGEFSAVQVYIQPAAGSAYEYVGEAKAGPWYSKYTTEFNVTDILDTVDKVKYARLMIRQRHKLWTAVDHVYLKVYGCTFGAEQAVNDYFIVDMRKPYDRVTGILIECRNNPNMYARSYNIQYTTLSNCCSEKYPVSEDYWYDFTPKIEIGNPTLGTESNDARDILHSWQPQNDVRCVRIKLLSSCTSSWEISQIYIWQADELKYRLYEDEDL